LELSLEIIRSALLTAGSGGIAGFIIGFALKKVIKILAVIVGIFLGTLIYFQSQSFITINWAKLESLLESTMPTMSNSVSDTSLVNNITGSMGLPLLGGLSLGLVVGFTRG